MMGNKDYLSGGCDLPGKLCYEKLDLKIKKKKNRNWLYDFLYYHDFLNYLDFIKIIFLS